MSEVEERLLEETDYELEVRRSIEFSTACANLNNVVFPEYYPELSSKRIITMDWLEGQTPERIFSHQPIAGITRPDWAGPLGFLQFSAARAARRTCRPTSRQLHDHPRR
jgi:predicted unusual protein kinase regulating ubiquinone biosynthesis (AarF/ABC1/UbiB family)